MRMSPRTGLVILALFIAVVGLHEAAAQADSWWKPAGPVAGGNDPAKAIERVFGGATAADQWEIKGDAFTVEHDDALGRDVLTATLPPVEPGKRRAAGLTINGKTQYTGARVIRAWLRLRNDISPGTITAAFTVARTLTTKPDPAKPGQTPAHEHHRRGLPRHGHRYGHTWQKPA